jgi:hypothetical protein
VDDRQSGLKNPVYTPLVVPIFLKKKFKKKVPHSIVFTKKERSRILAMTVIATRFFDKSFVFSRQD